MAEPSLGFIYSVSKDVAKLANKYLSVTEDRSKASLEQHCTWAEGWSSHIQIFGMTKPMSVDRDSISLSITDRPRKFFSPDYIDQDPELHTEESILSDLNNYVILGDPGCGKTTLFKRLSRHLIIDEPRSPNDQIDAPIVILARDLHEHNTLYHHICAIFGVEIKKFDMREHGAGIVFSDDKARRIKQESDLREAFRKNAETATESAVYKILETRRFALLIDGIDEIDSTYRPQFEKDLSNIINTSPRLKVLCTCRMGDWTRSIATINLLAIRALSEDEIAQVVKLWTKDADEFLHKIASVPYKDVLDRPLFLTLLLIIFEQGQELPDCPVDVYERITWLLIDRWDKERDLVRHSKFSSFLSEKKLRFLSALAYELMFKIREKRFKTKSLQGAYQSLCGRFRLPPDEFREVLDEIESHTGILVESGYDHFEFCHLTVQEFLAAKHLVGLAETPDFVKLLGLSPATLAVATSLAAEPSGYVASVIQAFCKDQIRLIRLNQQDNFSNLYPYLSRLRLEMPEFSVSHALALATMALWNTASEHRMSAKMSGSDRVVASVFEFSQIPAVRESVSQLMLRDGVSVRREEHGWITLRSVGKEYRFHGDFPENIGVQLR